MSYTISKISRNSSFLRGGEGTLEYIVSYAISKITRNSSFLRGGGEQSRVSASLQISRNSSFLKGGGRAELNVSDLANFQEFFISQGWGESRAQYE